MNFGSDYVYMYEAPSYEYISDEELEEGMNLSDSGDSGSDEDARGFGDMADIAEVGDTTLRAYAADGAPAPPAPELMPRAVGSGGGPVPPPPPGGPPAVANMHTVPPAPRAAGRGGKKSKKPTSHWRRTKGSTEKASADSSPSKHRRRVRQGDTNIVTVKFDKLISPSHMHAGDPQPCSSCSGILSSLSKLETQEDNKVWTCEFCSTRNLVDMEEEEIPAEQDVTFMLEPALSTMASGPTGMDESLVIFCVDVSGSMCVTTEVPGHIELRGGSSLRRAQLMNRDRSDQHLPRQSRNVTYISRLQSVQAAIDHQLQEMSKEFPNRRVALITFSNEVTVYGDGKKDPVCIAGDKLAKKDTLKSIAEEQPFPDSIKTSRQQLGQKLFDLEECGPTALGPALLVATTMAAKNRGSKVILCTDGLANIGMGKLDNFKSDEEVDEAGKFYEEISQLAVDGGVSISVITIKGTDCKLVEIGKMADQTGGQVNIVDPLKLTEEFSTILANKIIATNVEATMILHKELFFFYEETEESRVVKNIGNVTAVSEISFEYGIRTKDTEAQKKTEESKMDVDPGKERSKSPEQMEVEETKETAKGGDSADAQLADKEATHMDVPKIIIDPAGPSTSSGASGSSEGAGAPEGNMEERTELPFQLQIRYTDTEGAKALRVITQTKPITRDRKKAEKLAKLDVLAAHTAMTSAKMAQDGLYTMSRERALMNQRVAWRNTRDDDGLVVQNRTQYKKAFGKIRSMENYLAVRQQSERRTTGRTHSDEEDEDEEAPRSSSLTARAPSKGKSKSFLSRLRKKRSETTEDSGAAMLYKGKHGRAFFDETD